MNKCPKCSSYQISGPRFKSVFGHETLEYTCQQCGYSETRPPHDADRKDQQ